MFGYRTRILSNNASRVLTINKVIYFNNSNNTHVKIVENKVSLNIIFVLFIHN